MRHILAGLAIGAALALQGPQFPLRNTAFVNQIPGPAASPNIQPICFVSNTFTAPNWSSDTISCKLRITNSSEQAIVVGVSAGGTNSVLGPSDSNGTLSDVGGLSFTGDALGSVHLYIEPQAAVGTHTISLGFFTGSSGNNYRAMWAAYLVHTPGSNPIIVGPVVDGRSSGGLDSFSCPDMTSTGTNITAITLYGVPGFGNATTNADTAATISGDSNMSQIALGGRGYTGTNAGATSIVWQWQSFSTGPGTITPKIDMSIGAPGNNGAIGCVGIVVQND